MLVVVLFVAGLLIWLCTYFFFGNAQRTKGLGSIAVFILQAVSIWTMFSVILLALHVYSYQVINLGYLIFPGLVASVFTLVLGPALTLYLRHSKKER